MGDSVWYIKQSNIGVTSKSTKTVILPVVVYSTRVRHGFCPLNKNDWGNLSRMLAFINDHDSHKEYSTTVHTWRMRSIIAHTHRSAPSTPCYVAKVLECTIFSNTVIWCLLCDFYDTSLCFRMSFKYSTYYQISRAYVLQYFSMTNGQHAGTQVIVRTFNRIEKLDRVCNSNSITLYW